MTYNEHTDCDNQLAECEDKIIELLAANAKLREALEEASRDFYYIHQHPEDAHTDSYGFMNKVDQALKEK